MIESILRDLRHAIRALVHRPVYAVTVLVCLAIGIGANVATLDLVDLLLLRAPPHIRAPENVVRLNLKWAFPGGGHPPMADWGLPYDDVTTLARRVPGFASVGGYAIRDLSVGAGANARARRVGFAAESFFQTLGTQPLLGRFFVAPSAAAAAPANSASEVVLSYEFWRDHYSASEQVIGQSLRVGSGTYTVIGVAPEGFRGVEIHPTAVWLSVAAAEHELFADDAGQWHHQEWLQPIARLANGVPAQQAYQQASRALQLAYAARFGAHFDAFLTVVPESIRGEGSTPAGISVTLWITALSIIVLFAACVNVAGLYVARALTRRTELAIRLALGATECRIVQQQTAEGLILAVCGGAVGVLIAMAASSTFLVMLVPDALPDSHADAMRAIGFAAVVTAIAWIGGSVVPAIRLIRASTFSDLRVGAAAAGSARSAVRSLLLAAQVALTTVLLVTAGLFIRSFHNASATTLGFDAQRVIVAQIDFRRSGSSAGERSQTILSRVAALPGVQSAAYSSAAPFVTSMEWPDFSVPGSTSPAPAASGSMPLIELNSVSPSFFATIRQPLLQGKTFDVADADASRRVAIVNQAMVRAYWPHGNVLGSCIKISTGGMGDSLGATPCREVVGVVAGTRVMHLQEPDKFQVYVPQSQRVSNGSYILLIRTRGDPSQLIPNIRRIIGDAIPLAPLVNVQTYPDILAPSLGPWRLGASVFLVFGLCGLSLAVFGLYGAFSYNVGQRTREIGVRLALGAGVARVRWMVMAEVLRLASVGIVAGLVIAVAAGRVVSSLLVSITASDPLTLSVVALIILVASVIAVYPTALRAARIDPAVAMRVD